MKSIEQNLSAYKAGQVGQAGQRAPLGSVWAQPGTDSHVRAII